MTVATQHIIPQFKPQSAGDFGDARADFPWWSYNLATIKDKNAPLPHRFAWNSPQWRVYRRIMDTLDPQYGGIYEVIKYRQGAGISTLMTNWSCHKACTQPNFTALHTAHDSITTGLMLDMIKCTYDNLPPDITLKDGKRVSVQPEQIKSNRNELVIGHKLDRGMVSTSKVSVQTAGGDEGVGRGGAINCFHASEIGDHKAYDDGKIVGGVVQSLSDNKFVVYEGTPNGSYGYAYSSYQDAKNGDSATIPIFLPYFWDDRFWRKLDEGEVIVPMNEFEEQMMNGTNTYEGHKVEPERVKWYRMQKGLCPKSLEMTPEQWMIQEFPHNDVDCWITSSTTYFVDEYVDKMMRFAEKWERERPHQRYSLVGDEWVKDQWGPLRLCEEPISDATYVIGGDAAKGLEHGDFDTATIIKRVVDGPDEVVGYWRTHENDKDEHGRAMAELGRWFNKALLAIENNPGGHGNSVNKALENMHYPRIYIQTMQDEGKFSKGIRKEYGFNTSSKTKSLYLADMQTAMRKWCKGAGHPDYLDGIQIPFTAIVGELRTFEKIDGKTEAAKGCHDDLVISTSIPTHLRTGVRATHRNKPLKEVRKEVDQGIGYKEMLRFTGKEDELDKYKGIFQP